jgi:hypothetical protein
MWGFDGNLWGTWEIGLGIYIQGVGLSAQILTGV